MKEEGANYRAELGVQGKMAEKAFDKATSEEASPEEGMAEEAMMGGQMGPEMGGQQMMPPQ
jgi:hypothetical protein